MKIPDDQWHAIDEAIFANLKLDAIKAIRTQTACSLREALEVLSNRYTKLRADVPQRFDCTDADYWAGFYS